jgi:molybdenum cofactor synthesis domain-containing protein
MSKNASLKAALVIIGDEILSGRTQDTNTRWIAGKLGERGIALDEVRVVPDVQERIVEAVNAMRARNDYVFTTGGIGPTHDDITSESIAAAFGVAIGLHPEAVKMLEAHYHAKGMEVTEARKRMAMIPEGARLILNTVSGAPGFVIDNVHVMAGVPHIMQAMLEHVLPGLGQGAVVQSFSLDVQIPESELAGPFKALAARYPDISMGSYPFMRDGKWGATLVLRSTDEHDLARASEDLRAMIQALSR